MSLSSSHPGPMRAGGSTTAYRPGSGSASDGAPLAICHLTAPAPVGGLEQVVTGLSCLQKARGHDVRVIAVVVPGTDSTPFLDSLHEAGIRVDVLRFGARAYVRERMHVRGMLAAELPDVLHTHGYRSDLLHYGNGRSLRIPLVTTIHGMSRLGGLSHLFEWAHVRLVRRWDAICAVSEPLRGELLSHGTPASRLHVIPNGWNGQRPDARGAAALRERLGIRRDVFTFGWVGRVVSIKGGDVFIDALAGMPGDWQAVIVGDGPQRPELEARAAAAGLGDRVVFAGEVANAAALMPGFDAFVLSSRSEGTPMVLFEAMAAGVPIVAAAVGGVPDVVGGGASLLVPSEDAGALRANLRALLERPALRNELRGEATARLHDAFAPDRWADRYDTVYRRVIAEASAARRQGRRFGHE